MALAFFPLYPDDFEAATAHLSMLEDGAYNRLLRLCWRTPGCSIPADEAWIFRKLRVSGEDEAAAVRSVLAEYFRCEKGRYSNKRLTAEAEKARASHARRVEAGKKSGGPAKSLKTRKNGFSNAGAMLCNQNQNQNHKKNARVNGYSEADLYQLFSALRSDSEPVRRSVTPAQRAALYEANWISADEMEN